MVDPWSRSTKLPSDPIKDLTSMLPDQFQGLLSKASAAAAPEYANITKAEKKFAQDKGDIGIQKAEAEAKYAKKGIGGEQAVYKKFEKQLMEPAPTIQYNEETSKSMASLATLLPVAAMMFGNKSQLSAIGAMNAMSGVLAGHQQGNQERIALETKNFEQKMNEFKTHQEQIKGAFERALQAAKLNASAAQAALKVDLAKLDAQLLNAEVDQKGVTRVSLDNLDRINNVTKLVEQSLSGINKATLAATQGFGNTAELGRLVGPELAYGTDEKSAGAALDRFKAIKQVRDLKIAADDPDIKFGEVPTMFARVAGLIQRNVSDTLSSNLKPLEGKEISPAELYAAVDKSLTDAGLSAADKNSVFYKNAIFTILAAERAATGRSFLPVGIVNRLTPLLDPKGLSKAGFLQIMSDYETRISQGLPPQSIDRAMKNLGGPTSTTATPAAPVAAEDPLGLRTP